jgi:hypothetical protein
MRRCAFCDEPLPPQRPGQPGPPATYCARPRLCRQYAYEERHRPRLDRHEPDRPEPGPLAMLAKQGRINLADLAVVEAIVAAEKRR